jgi:hypothetical protein
VQAQSSDPTCAPTGDVSVTIQDNTLTLTNSALRSFVMSFDPHPDGSFSRFYADASEGYMLIRGRIVGNILEADIN